MNDIVPAIQEDTAAEGVPFAAGIRKNAADCIFSGDTVEKCAVLW